MRPSTTDALAQVDVLLRSAFASNRFLTADERAHVDNVLTVAAQERDEDQARDAIEAMRGSKAFGGGIGAALLSAGFDYKSSPSVTVSGFPALGGRKVAAFLPPTEDLNPRPPADVLALPRDTRYLHPALPSADAGTLTAIADYRQTVRGVVGDVERDLDATTTKAELSVGIEAVQEPLRQVAVLLSEVPNVVLQTSALFVRFFRSEGADTISAAVDAHTVARIAAANPPQGNTGTGLVEQTRRGITSMRAVGANPSLLVVSLEQAADLDLTVDAAGSYVFDVGSASSGSPWNLRVVERPGQADAHRPTEVGHVVPRTVASRQRSVHRVCAQHHNAALRGEPAVPRA